MIFSIKLETSNPLNQTLVVQKNMHTKLTYTQNERDINLSK